MPTPPPPRLARRLAARAERPARLLGWLVLALATGLAVLGESGRLTPLVRERLEARLAPLGEPIALEEASLAWFVPALRLRGLSIGAGGETLRLEECEVRVGLSLARGLHVSAVVVRGGQVTLSPALENGVRGVLAGEGDDGADEPDDAAAPPLPALAVRDLQVDVEHALTGRLPVGRCDLDLRPGRRPTLRGRLRPTMRAGAPAGGAIFLTGTETASGEIEVRALGTDLAVVSTRAVATLLERETGLELAARLTLDARATVQPARGRVVAGEARLAIDGGELRLGPHVAPFEELHLSARLRLAPGDGPATASDAWHGRARVTGAWGDVAFHGGARAGDESISAAAVETWLVVPRLEATEELRALAGDLEIVHHVLDVYGMRGVAPTRASARLPRGWDPVRDGVGALEAAVDVRSHGAVTVTYHGFPNPLTCATDQGFPLPIRDVRGHVVYAHRPTLDQREIAGIVELVGRHPGGGPVRATGVVGSPPASLPSHAPGRGRPEMWLRIEGERVPIDAELGRALDGLAGAVPPQVLRDRFRPKGGRFDLDLELWRRPGLYRGVASRVVAELENVGITPRELPVPLHVTRALVEVVNEGRRDAVRPGETGVRFRGEGALAAAAGVSAVGFTRSDQVRSPTAVGEPPATLGAIEVRARELTLSGTDVDALAEHLPGLAPTRAALAPEGRVDVRYARSQPDANAAARATVEIAPSGPLELAPPDLGLRATDVRGRLLAVVDEPPALRHPPRPGDPPPPPPRITARLRPLRGELPGGLVLAVVADLASAAPGTLRLVGAGLDVEDRALWTRVGAAFGAGDRVERAADALGLDGRVDLEVELSLPPIADALTTARAGGLDAPSALAGGTVAGSAVDGTLDGTPAGARDGTLAGTVGDDGTVLSDGAAIARSEAEADEVAAALASARVRVVLRGNDLATAQGLSLSDLEGVLELEDGVLRGDGLEARLAQTAVKIGAARLEPTPDGFRFHTTLDARDLPLDREHLRFFMDPDTLNALIDELDWRGRVDLHGTEIELTGGGGSQRLVARGDLTLSDMFLSLGLPISIRSARAKLEELVYEGGHVRGWGRLEDLYGRVADRDLGPASMQVAYYDTHLSIENLDGAFEGGSLRSLGGRSLAAAFDLRAPWPFQVALDLGGDGRGADVRGLLRDLFPSAVANRGRVFGTLNLRGELGHLLGIEGNGSVRVRDTVLWAVPVFRALFATLGLDDTAAQFDRLVTRFTVDDGRIVMHDIEVKSDLLHLVGRGTLGFDGSLHHDLEVQYGLVNRLGPLKRILYWVQNNLLAVSIRGDMARPKVALTSALLRVFGGDAEFHALPLPDLAPLPPRF